MPILNIPVKEWGADLAEQAKRKAQAAMQQVQDAGSDALAESQRQAKEARDEWMKTQIDAAMNPIREAGHAAAEGLSVLGDRAGANLQENASAVAEAPIGQAIGEKASGLGTFAQGVRQDLRKGADAAVAADTAMDTALSERDAADRAAAPTIPEEVSAPPSFKPPGALPAMSADTLPNPVEFPTNVAKNYLGSMGKSAEDLTDPEEWKKTAEAAREIAPEVLNPVQTGARLISDQGARDTFVEKDLPAAGQVLKTVGDIGNVVPNAGEQLENVAASVALEATKDTGLPDPVKAGIAVAAGSGVPTNLLKRAFKVPGGVSSQLDEAGRAAMGDGKLAAVDGVGDIPEPTKMPDMHRPQEFPPGDEQSIRDTQDMLNLGAARRQQLLDAGLPADNGHYQYGSMPDAEWDRIKPPDADPDVARAAAQDVTERTMGPVDPTSKFPDPHMWGSGRTRALGMGTTPHGDPDMPAFPDTHGAPPEPVDIEFPERAPGEPRDPNGLMGPTREEAFGPRQPATPSDELTPPPSRAKRAQDALENGAGSEFYRRVEAGEFDHLDDGAFNKELISDLTEPGESADRGLFSGTRPMEGPFPDITQRPPGMGGNEYGRSVEAPPLDELGPERSNFRVPGTSGMSVADQIAGRTLGAVQGGIAGDRQDEDDEGWERLGRIGSMAALGAAAPPQNVKAASLAKGLLRNADRVGQGMDELGVRAGAVEYPGRTLTDPSLGEAPGESTPAYYSKLERSLDKLPRQGTSQQMKKTILAQGVRPDELRWTGIEDYLDLMDEVDPDTGKPRVVSLDELRQNVREGRVNLRESVRERPVITPEMTAEGERLRQAAADADEANTAAYRYTSVAWDNARARLSLEGHANPRRARTGQDPEYLEAVEAHGRALEARDAADRAYKQHLETMQGNEATRPKYEEYSQGLKAGPENERLDGNAPVQPGFHDFEDTSVVARPGYREIVLNVDTKGKTINPAYKNTHFGPAENTPLHMRVTDRTLPDGRKVLHIEELQSDWHQAATKPLRDAQGKPILDENGKPVRMGYQKNPEEQWAQQAQLEREADDLVSREGLGVLQGWAGEDPRRRSIRWIKEGNAVRSRMSAIGREMEAIEPGSSYGRGAFATDPDYVEDPAYTALSDEMRSLQRHLDDIQEFRRQADRAVMNLESNEARPPHGPWEKSWNELGMKRALRMAAEEGYDGVSWTPALVHQQRYGQAIPERFRRIEYDPDKHILYAHEHDGWIRELEEVTPEQLPDYIGPDLTQRMLGDEPMTNFRTVDGQPVRERLHTLRGDDLTVTRPGSKGFETQYEKVMPQTADALAKPYGQKSYQGEIELTPGGERTAAHILEFSPEMKKGINEQGFPLFIRDQQGGRAPGMAIADQVAGRALGAVQGGVAADRADEDDTGWERAGRIATGAALGAAAKPANVNLGSLARGAVRNADRLGTLLGDEAGELRITSGAGDEAPRGPGRPRKYTEADRTPPTRPPKDYSGDLVHIDAIPDDLVAEEAMDIASAAGNEAKVMRASAKRFHEGEDQAAVLAAAKRLQDSYIGVVKSKLSPVERARFDVEYALERQGKPRPKAEGVRSGNTGSDVLPETPASSQVDETPPPRSATPGEGVIPPRTPAPKVARASEAAADVTDEGVTVTETPEEIAARARQRARALAEQETGDTGAVPDETPQARPPAQDMGRAEAQSKQPIPLTDEEAELEAVAQAQRTAEARARGEDVEEVGPTGQAMEGEAPQRRAPQQDMARREEQSKQPLPVTPEEEAAEEAARAARATESGSNNEVELGDLGRALENEAPVARGKRPKDAGPHMGDWLEAIRYGWGLLANPAPAAADAVAGVAEIPWTRVRNRLIDLGDPNRKLVREATAKGYKSGGAEGRRRAGEIMRTGKELKELMPGAAAEDTPRSLMRRYQERGQKNWALAAGAAEFASRGRNALDAMSHGSLYLGQLYREAAKNVNKTSIPKGTPDWWDAVERFVDTAEDAKVGKNTPEGLARAKAMDQADRALGRNDPGYVGTHIGNTLKHPVLRQFLPLFRTGYNITMRGLERSPIGAGAILVDKVRGKPVSAERVMDSAMGSSIMLPMAAYAIQSGNITGAGPEDQRTKDDLVKEGWKPFSIRTPDGVYRSYTRFGAAAAPLAMAGAIGDASRYHEVDEPTSKRMAHAAGNFGKWMAGQFILRSIGNISDVVTDPVKAAPSYLGRMAGQYAGVGSLTGAVASAMDPYERDTKSGGPDTPLPEWAQPFVNEIVKNIPGARESLNPVYDEFGTEKPNPGYGPRGFINPYTAGPSPDELDYRNRDLRRYRGSESAAEDARIAESIQQWKDEIGQKRGPLGEEASSLAGRFLGSDDPDYIIARAEARAADEMRKNQQALDRLGG